MAQGDRHADDVRALDGLRVESDDLRASRKRLALAADAERRGLERALHDGVQQHLVGFAANLELAARSLDADPAAAKDLLAEMATRHPGRDGAGPRACGPDLPRSSRWGAWLRRYDRRRRMRRSLPDRDRAATRPIRPRSRARSSSASATCSSTPRQVRRWRSRHGAMRRALAFDIVVDGDLHADRSLLGIASRLSGGRSRSGRSPDT